MVRAINFQIRRLLMIRVLLLMAMPGVQAASDFDSLNITPPKQRLPAPDFSLPTLNGGELRLSDFRGQLVLLNFWASFCAPCLEEMPALQHLWDEYRDAGFVVLAVAADRGSIEPVAAFIESGDYRFPVVLDVDGEVRNRYEVRALPTSYLIGADGRFLGRVVGPRDWYTENYRQLVGDLLSGKPVKGMSIP